MILYNLLFMHQIKIQQQLHGVNILEKFHGSIQVKVEEQHLLMK